MKRLFLSLFVTICLINHSFAKQASTNINNAVIRGMNYLKGAQQENGSWRNCTGTTGLALKAIVLYGVPEGMEETVDKAVTFLTKRPVPKRTYESACLAMALQEVDSEKYIDTIQECAEFIESAQLPNGMWTYRKIGDKEWQKLKEQFDSRPDIYKRGNVWEHQKDYIERNNPKGKYELPFTPIRLPDNSNTQFALLGLRAAHRAGIQVDKEVVRNCQNHFVRTQNYDYGWGYREYEIKSRGSMTCAAIASLCILDDVFKSGWYFHRRKIRKNNVGHGKQWMAENFSVTENPGYHQNYLYYMYSMERAGILSKTKQFGDHDWYKEGSDHLCSIQQADGSWSGSRFGRASVESDTAFAILFLKKGAKFHKAPVKIPLAKEKKDKE